MAVWRWLKRASAADKRLSPVPIDVEYAVNGPGVNSCAAGVIIDGAVYQLVGEPPTGVNSVHFGGNGQR